jgi:hypothetical protein
VFDSCCCWWLAVRDSTVVRPHVGSRIQGDVPYIRVALYTRISNVITYETCRLVKVIEKFLSTDKKLLRSRIPLGFPFVHLYLLSRTRIDRPKNSGREYRAMLLLPAAGCSEGWFGAPRSDVKKVKRQTKSGWNEKQSL